MARQSRTRGRSTIHPRSSSRRRGWSGRGRIPRYSQHRRAREEDIKPKQLPRHVLWLEFRQASHRPSCPARRVASDTPRVDRHCRYHHLRAYHLHDRRCVCSRPSLDLRPQRYYIHVRHPHLRLHSGPDRSSLDSLLGLSRPRHLHVLCRRSRARYHQR